MWYNEKMRYVGIFLVVALILVAGYVVSIYLRYAEPKKTEVPIPLPTHEKPKNGWFYPENPYNNGEEGKG